MGNFHKSVQSVQLSTYTIHCVIYNGKFIQLTRGNRTPGSLAALQPRLRLAVAQAKYCNSFQLTHMPRGNHAQSIASNAMATEGRHDIITALTT